MSIPLYLRKPLFRVLAVLLFTTLSVNAQTWDGSEADNNWSTDLNWDGGVAPVSTGNVVFGDVDKTTEAAPNSLVNNNFTIRTLTFNNTGDTANDWQNVEIAENQTLTITVATTGAFAVLVGGVANVATQAKITGDGSFVINGGTAADFVVRGGSAASGTPYATPSLDMSGLASFDATVRNFLLGSSTVGLATVTLAADSTITANTLTIGSSNKHTGPGNGGNSVLNLGAENTLNVNSISVASTNNDGRTGGTMQFAEEGSSVIIRGRTGGDSRADFQVGRGTDGNGTLTNIADFTTGNIDAMFGDLIVGSSAAGNGALIGNFLMDDGTVDATSVVVGRRTGAGSGAGTGNLTIAGGDFQAGTMTLASHVGSSTNTTNGTVNISGDADVQVGTLATPANLTMGEVSGIGNHTSNATVNLTGGGLTVHGNLAEGANAGTGNITSTLTLDGGTLDLTSNNIVVDTFNARSGTLQNLNEFNNGGNIVKTTAGTLVLDGNNDYSGDTVVNEGTFNLASSGSMTFYIGTTGINNQIANNSIIDLDGTFVFDLSGAAAVGLWQIIENTVTASYDQTTFNVAGFNESAPGIWTMGNYTFTESSGELTAIPEPTTVMMVLGGFGVLIGLQRGRRSRRD